VPNHFLGLKARLSLRPAGRASPCATDVSQFFERARCLWLWDFWSGKTTLLSLLGCLLTPDEGTVFVDGVAINGLSEAERTVLRQKKISFVFQAFRLFRSLSAIDNVALGFELRDPTLRAGQSWQEIPRSLRFGKKSSSGT